MYSTQFLMSLPVQTKWNLLWPPYFIGWPPLFLPGVHFGSHFFLASIYHGLQLSCETRHGVWTDSWIY
jgi:hypothetical protein